MGRTGAWPAPPQHGALGLTMRSSGGPGMAEGGREQGSHDRGWRWGLQDGLQCTDQAAGHGHTAVPPRHAPTGCSWFSESLLRYFQRGKERFGTFFSKNWCWNRMSVWKRMNFSSSLTLHNPDGRAGRTELLQDRAGRWAWSRSHRPRADPRELHVGVATIGSLDF